MKTFTIHFPDELYEKLKKFAFKKKMTMKGVVVRCLEVFFQEQET